MSSRCVVSGTILSCLLSCFSVSGTLLSCLSSCCVVVSGTILSCPLSCFSKTSDNLIWLTGLKAPITKLFLFKYVIPFLSKGHFTTGVTSFTRCFVNQRWQAVKKALSKGGPEAIDRRSAALDVSTVSVESAQAAQALMKDVSEKMIIQQSRAAFDFYEWVS